ncbi:MAG: nucleotide exchange factor GrpE [Sphaerochaetaceae bacterium]|jgi:molecular chaperone GrpE|nr:nucleotide exchange factor GrpE [Sphaerochaetaceae bacterium]HHU89259.1 nucleotide exchange factor GrpE [Spirochaetales bacterium]
MDKKECLEKIEEEVEETSVTPCVEELEDEVKRLKEELAKSQEEYLRKVADLDNYRKRLVREKESAVQFANENLLNDLIPILDDLDRAIVAGEEGDDVKAYGEGVKLIQKQLLDLLERNWGLKRMDGIVGGEFSPHEHEAMLMEEGEQYSTETVLAELQKGYYLHDRVLRTAKVKVGKPL